MSYFMDGRVMLIEVVEAYASKYSDPISFDAGVAVSIEREDAEYPGWFWCRVASGKEGWVHRSYLSALIGTTTSTAAYSARELTVRGGERGKVIRSLDGWELVRLDSGEEGWVPSSHIRATTASRTSGENA
jgi:SH3-like domain-containing protein